MIIVKWWRWRRECREFRDRLVVLGMIRAETRNMIDMMKLSGLSGTRLTTALLSLQREGLITRQKDTQTSRVTYYL